jgi:peptidoglycan/LPS O-acetylase OafA/YrhL
VSVTTHHSPISPAPEVATAQRARRVGAPEERLHYIDGFRAVAILLVMTHHFATAAIGADLASRGWPRLGGGLGWITNSGVELFFVLSGVVLLRPYLRGNRAFMIGRYTVRRVARLWPPFLASWLFAGAVVMFDTVSPTWYNILPRFTIVDWLRQIGIVNLGWPIYNLAWWSLTPEFAFYACAPLLIAIFGNQRATSRVIAVGTVAMLASIVFWDPRESNPGVRSGLLNAARQFLAYSPCFLAGVLLATTNLSRRIGISITAAGAIYFVLSLEIQRANVHSAFALLYTGLLVVAHTTRPIRRQLERPSMIWLGERSYSFFLTHFSLLYLADATVAHFVRGRTIEYHLGTRLLAAVGTMLVSMLLFWFVERKFAHSLATSDAFWPWQASTATRAADP